MIMPRLITFSFYMSVLFNSSICFPREPNSQDPLAEEALVNQAPLAGEDRLEDQLKDLQLQIDEELHSIHSYGSFYSVARYFRDPQYQAELQAVFKRPEQDHLFFQNCWNFLGKLSDFEKDKKILEESEMRVCLGPLLLQGEQIAQEQNCAAFFHQTVNQEITILCQAAKEEGEVQEPAYLSLPLIIYSTAVTASLMQSSISLSPQP